MTYTFYTQGTILGFIDINQLLYIYNQYTRLLDPDSKCLSSSHEQWNIYQDILMVTASYMHP